MYFGWHKRKRLGIGSRARFDRCHGMATYVQRYLCECDHEYMGEIYGAQDARFGVLRLIRPQKGVNSRTLRGG